MIFTSPFALKDRLDPGKDIDEGELIRTVNAIDDLNDRPRPFRVPGRIDHADAFRSIRNYQQSRNLKPDGIVRPKGPTQQRLAADLHALKTVRTPSPQQRLFGTTGNLPITYAVGFGQTNAPDDLRMTGRALTLAGSHIRVPLAYKDKASAQLAAAIPAPLRQFQARHGLKQDGVMKPDGQTQHHLSHIIAPQIDHLIGRDHLNPRPWKTPEPEMVARTLKHRPTTIRTFVQDDRTLPTIVEHKAAAGLFGEVGRRMEEFYGAKIEPANSRSPVPGGGKYRGLRAASAHTKRYFDLQRAREEIINTLQKPEVEFAIESEERQAELARYRDTLAKIDSELAIIRRGLTDEQNAFGRPTWDEGDAYSGNDTYGDPDGR